MTKNKADRKIWKTKKVQKRSLHLTIKFTYSFSSENVNILDTTVHLINNHIQTKLYIKPIDTYQYLFPSSFHPRLIIKNIPKSSALHIKLLHFSFSTTAYFQKHAAPLISYLISRSYEEKHIRKIIDKVRTIQKKDLPISTPNLLFRRRLLLLLFIKDKVNLITSVANLITYYR